MRIKNKPILTIEQKWEIFRSADLGKPRKEIAKDFNVSLSTINTVCSEMMGLILYNYQERKKIKQQYSKHGIQTCPGCGKFTTGFCCEETVNDYKH